jgi:hypothetical protein
MIEKYGKFSSELFFRGTQQHKKLFKKLWGFLKKGRNFRILFDETHFF